MWQNNLLSNGSRVVGEYLIYVSVREKKKMRLNYGQILHWSDILYVFAYAAWSRKQLTSDTIVVVQFVGNKITFKTRFIINSSQKTQKCSDSLLSFCCTGFTPQDSSYQMFKMSDTQWKKGTNSEQTRSNMTLEQTADAD